MVAISQSFRCFDEVARRGSIRKAAESLHLTAAAVHQQILNLEAQVGTPLFDRLPRGMQLTSAGEIMVAAVRRSQRDFDSALLQLRVQRALGDPALWRNALTRAQPLAGDRAIPSDLLQPPGPARE